MKKVIVGFALISVFVTGCGSSQNENAVVVSGAPTSVATSAATDSWTAEAPTRICAEANDVRTDDEKCIQSVARPTTPASPRWYYLPQGGYIPPFGSRLSTGSYLPLHGLMYESSSASRSRVANRVKPRAVRAPPRVGTVARPAPRIARPTFRSRR